MKYIFLFALTFLHQWIYAQYMPEYGVHIVEPGFVPANAKYIGSAQIGNAYFRGGVPNVLNEILSALDKYEGNTASVYPYYYQNGVNTLRSAFVEIWQTDDVTTLQVVPEEQYFDSLKQSILAKQKQGSLTVYNIPKRVSTDRGPAMISVMVDGSTEAQHCGMGRYRFCNFNMEQETSLTLITNYNLSDKDRAGFPATLLKDEEYKLSIKPGEVHFLGYFKKNSTVGKIIEVDFIEGYRICRSYAYMMR